MSYSYSYQYYPDPSFWIGYTVILLAICAVSIIASWKIFTKAGVPGWAAIIPFYNSYKLYELAWGNGIYFLFGFIPCVNIVVSAILSVKLAKSFGYETVFGIVALWLFAPIGYLILAFGGAEYIGPDN